MKKEKWRVLKFIITSSSVEEDIGRESYAILKPYSKDEYLSHYSMYATYDCPYPSSMLRNPDNMDNVGIYVDLKTRKLWKIVKDNVADYSKFAIESALSGASIDILPYDPNIAARMIPLKTLKTNLVEWWCK